MPPHRGAYAIIATAVKYTKQHKHIIMYIVKRSFLIIILIKVYIIITVLINNNTFHKVKLTLQ